MSGDAVGEGSGGEGGADALVGMGAGDGPAESSIRGPLQAPMSSASDRTRVTGLTLAG